MRPTTVLVSIAVGLSAACVSSGERPNTPFEPQPADTATPATPDTVAGSLRGYAFTAEQGATNILVTVNGASASTCADSLAGQPVLRLPITAGIMARLEQNRVNGGRIYVQPITQFRFTGRGEQRAGHDGLLSVGTTTLGTTSHADQAMSPVQTRSVDVTPELPLAASLLRLGDTLRIRFDARVSARLEADCGQSTVGQVRWRLWGVVLWLAE
jgi:hypothetical protein